jgi:hypothetical protein
MHIPTATIKIPPPSRLMSFEPEFANTGVTSPTVDWVSPVVTSDSGSVVVDESGTVVDVVGLAFTTNTVLIPADA